MEKYINRIICGDCLEVMKDFPDNSVDFVFTDPPYNAGKDYGDYKDNLPIEEYCKWMVNVIGECQRISRNGIAVFLSSKATKMFWDIMPTARVIIVQKGSISTPNNDFIYRQWRSLLVTRKPVNRCYDLWTGLRMPGEGYFFREPRYPHPGLTSQRLTERIFRFFTKEREVVLDPFNGTGTTSVVAKASNRKYIGIELNPTYCKIADTRLVGVQVTLPIIEVEIPKLEFQE